MIYLIHFDEKISHAQHYVGCCNNLSKRLELHAKGKGARIIEVINEKGINWRLSRIWLNLGFKEERELKNRKNAGKYCPICSVEPMEFKKEPDFPISLIKFKITKEEILNASRNN